MQKHLFTLIYIFLYFIFSSQFTKANPNYTASWHTTLNGLSQNDVNNIFYDSKGFLWVATNDGLNRYDGYQFITYRIGDRGLNSNLISTIAEDKYSNLWIGTVDDGIYFYSRKRNEFVHSSKLYNSNPKVIDYSVRLIAIDKNDVVWFFSLKGDIFKFDFDYEKEKIVNLHRYVHPTGNFGLHSIKALSTPEADVFIGSNTGAYMYYNSDKKLKRLPDIHEPIYYITNVNKDRIILSYNDRLTLYNLKTRVQKELLTTTVRSITNLTGNKLWISNSNGIYLAEYDEASETLNNLTLISAINGLTNTSCISDNNGNMWMGYYKAGLLKIQENRKPFERINSGKPIGNNNILSIYSTDARNLWLGTEGTGLFLMKKDSANVYTQEKHYLPHESILCLVSDQAKSKLYCGTGNGIYSIELNTGSIQAISNTLVSVFSILPDSNYLWIGTLVQGLHRYNLSTGEIIRVTDDNELPSFVIRNLTLDTFGNIWIGTDQGISILSSESKYLNNVKIKKLESISDGKTDNLEKYYIVPMILTKFGEMWVGTLGRGLKIFKPQRNIQSIQHRSLTTSDGFVNNTIKALVEDKNGIIWVSTNKGISSVEPYSYLIKNYDISDGLLDYEFNEMASFCTSNGDLYFGCMRGVNKYRPIQQKQSAVVPKITLTDFFLFNRSLTYDYPLDKKAKLPASITETEKIKLKYNENSFSIEFALLDYSNDLLKNKYEYMLTNFDKQWEKADASRRLAVYTNIPPGKYKFLVKGHNDNNIWSEPRELTIIITPPLWMTWYAYMIYAVLLTAVLWFFRKKRLKNLEIKNKILLTNLEKKKTEDLLEMKTRFFTNVSHEFRTPLTIILSIIQRFRQEKSINSDESLTKYTKIIHHSSEELLRLITQLMDFSKNEVGRLELELKHLDFISFTKKVFDKFIFLAEDKNIKLFFESDFDKFEYIFDPNLIEEAINNLLSNAIKHTPEHAEIKVSVLDGEDKIFLKVQDAGKGIDPDIQKHLFERFYSKTSIDNTAVKSTGIGLALTKSIIEMHNGDIGYETKVGEGTIFWVSLPKSAEYDISTLTQPYVRKAGQDINEEKKENNKQIFKLLVVEDNNTINELLKELFETDYTVIQAENGEEGWNKTLEHFPDIILSDVMMPILDGLQLCEKVKKDDRTSHIPVVLLTARTDDTDLISGYNYRADAYCTKPYNNTVLKSIIDSIIANRKNLIQKFRGSIEINPAEITNTTSEQRFVDKIIKHIEDNIDNSKFEVKDLADHVGMSTVVLNKKLKSLFDTTANGFIRKIRLNRAANLLKTGKYSVQEVTYDVGFNDLKYFREMFRKEYGVTPTDYILKNKEEKQ